MPQDMVVSPYVGGSITITANTVSNLINLIQAQLDKNCPACPAELNLYADDANTTPIYGGALSPIGGALSAANYAWKISPLGLSNNRYTIGGYPGSNVMLGRLFVLSTATAVLHVEVWP